MLRLLRPVHQSGIGSASAQQSRDGAQSRSLFRGSPAHHAAAHLHVRRQAFRRYAPLCGSRRHSLRACSRRIGPSLPRHRAQGRSDVRTDAGHSVLRRHDRKPRRAGLHRPDARRVSAAARRHQIHAARGAESLDRGARRARQMGPLHLGRDLLPFGTAGRTLKIHHQSRPRHSGDDLQRETHHAPGRRIRCERRTLARYFRAGCGRRAEAVAGLDLERFPLRRRSRLRRQYAGRHSAPRLAHHAVLLAARRPLSRAADGLGSGEALTSTTPIRCRRRAMSCWASRRA